MYSDEPSHEYEKWNTYVRQHPEKIMMEAKIKDDWIRENEALNLCALKRIRSIVPPSIYSRYSLNLLLKELPGEVARRVWDNKILWLTRTPKSYISRLHASAFCYTYRYEDLDEVELRAVWASLPDRFECDPDGRKESWKSGIELTLKQGSTIFPQYGINKENLSDRDVEIMLNGMTRAPAYRYVCSELYYLSILTCTISSFCVYVII